MIAIVDTGGANIASVMFAVERLGLKAELTSDPDFIQSASKVIFPGVGAARDAMGRIQKKELTNCMKELSQPVLGVCLGMQLLFAHSEEGDVNGLGLIPGQVKKMLPSKGLSVPHMGWNQVYYRASDFALFKDIEEGSYFYFVHSYAAEDGEWTKGFCEHGQVIPSVVQVNNYFAVQFHPERSGKAGAQLLKNFKDL